MPQPRNELRAAREALGLTQSEAARRAGYKSKSGWAMVENGTNQPDPEQMRRIAEVVRRPVLEVFPELRELLFGGVSHGA